MDLVVKIERILEPQSFTSKKDGTVYTKRAFVGRTVNDKYPKPICFTCIGDEAWGRLNLRVGLSYNVSFDVSSREWNGRWFTEATCWRAVAIEIGNNTSSHVERNIPKEEKQYEEPPF
jgi:hypothetical protein